MKSSCSENTSILNGRNSDIFNSQTPPFITNKCIYKLKQRQDDW